MTIWYALKHSHYCFIAMVISSWSNLWIWLNDTFPLSSKLNAVWNYINHMRVYELHLLVMSYTSQYPKHSVFQYILVKPLNWKHLDNSYAQPKVKPLNWKHLGNSYVQPKIPQNYCYELNKLLWSTYVTKKLTDCFLPLLWQWWNSEGII